MLLLQAGDSKVILSNFIKNMNKSISKGEMTDYASAHWEYILISFFKGNHFQMDLFIEAIRCYSNKDIGKSQFEVVKSKVIAGEPITERDIQYDSQQEKEAIYTIQTVNELLQKIEVLDMALSEMMMMAPQFMEGGE